MPHRLCSRFTVQLVYGAVGLQCRRFTVQSFLRKVQAGLLIIGSVALLHWVI